MRSLLRYLPAFLTLLLPLLLLAWLGSSEFSRLEDRTKGILQSQAYSFLTAADKTLREELQKLASARIHAGLGKILEKEDLNLVQASRELGTDPFFLELFLLDGQAQMLAPVAPPAFGPAAPLRSLPLRSDGPERELLLADCLETMGDRVGAEQSYRAFIARIEQEGASLRLDADKRQGLMWAYFKLGGLLATQGDPAADAAYFKAGETAWRALGRNGGEGPVREDAAAIVVLSQLKGAELSGDPDRLLDLMAEISRGVHDPDCSDELLDEVVSRIRELLPQDPDIRQAMQTALVDNEIRKAGRRFVLDYNKLEAAHMHKAIALAQESAEGGVVPLVYRVLSTKKSSSLLVLRETSSSEEKVSRAAFVGLRLDLPAVLASFMDHYVTEGVGSFTLSILDPSGLPILPASMPPPPEDYPVDLLPLATIGDLELGATPITDPTAHIRETERNKALLALALILLAVGGAVFLLRSVNRASELARLKMQLVSRVSHELKTPLSVIKMYGETLGMGRSKDQAQTSKFAGIISQEVDRLTTMIERILDFSRQEAGTMAYEKSRIDIGQVLETVIEDYLPHLESQGFELEASISPGLLADIDSAALASAVLNLLENAVKYTPAGASEHALEVTLEARSGRAAIEICDRGVGIPRGEQGQIFSAFYRASTAGEARGAGLGLSLVRHFARAHGGDIEAFNRLGGGTTMRLTLPLSSQPPKTEKPEASEEEQLT